MEEYKVIEIDEDLEMVKIDRGKLYPILDDEIGGGLLNRENTQKVNIQQIESLINQNTIKSQPPKPVEDDAEDHKDGVQDGDKDGGKDGGKTSGKEGGKTSGKNGDKDGFQDGGEDGGKVNDNDAATGIPERRENLWRSKWVYLMCLIGSTIGPGTNLFSEYYSNILAYLCVYLMFMIFVGFPMLVMELSMGQYFAKGVIGVWASKPAFQGIGYACMFVGFLHSVATMILNSVSLMYLGTAVISPELPWMDCNNSWNTDKCITTFSECEYKDIPYTELYDNWDSYGDYVNIAYNKHVCQTSSNKSSYILFYDASTPTYEYYKNVFHRSHHGHMTPHTFDVDSLTRVNWRWAGCLLAVWILLFVASVKGFKWISKLSIGATVISFVLLLAIILRSATLRGAMDGLRYMTVIDSSFMNSINSDYLWNSAFNRVIYSIGILITCKNTIIGSHSTFTNSFYKDAVVACFVNVVIMVLFNCVQCMFTGQIANQEGVDINTYFMSESYGFVPPYTAILQGLSNLPGALIWIVIFYSLLIIITFNYQMWIVEGTVSSLTEDWKTLHNKRTYIVALLCGVGCLLGLFFITEFGNPYFSVVFESIQMLIPILLLLHWIYFIYCYRGQGWYNKMNEMLGYYPNFFCKAAWLVVIPIVSIIIIVMQGFRSYYTYDRFRNIGQIINFVVYIVFIVITLGIVIGRAIFIKIKKT